MIKNITPKIATDIGNAEFLLAFHNHLDQGNRIALFAFSMDENNMACVECEGVALGMPKEQRIELINQAIETLQKMKG
jgi:hypothetical protein